MQRARVFGSVVGVLALASACVTSGTSAGGGTFAEQPRRLTRAETDSAFAQAMADREGPRVSVSAEYGLVSSARRLRATFRLEDDAYVLIGHVDPDGVVNIVFPADPSDDGFVRGDKTYQTGEFFAGFTDQYRFRYAQAFNTAFHPDAYDGRGGYVFVVASWRPMHFEQFAGPKGWDSFEMSDDEYRNRVKPAINELASLLVGDNREAYTVQFAQYFETRGSNGAFRSAGLSNLEMCMGQFGLARFYGAGWSAIDAPPFGLLLGTALTSLRGQQYNYDAVGNCYYPAPQAVRYNAGPLVVAPRPDTAAVVQPPHMRSPGDTHRSPLDPRVPPRVRLGQGEVPALENHIDRTPRRVSPHYLDRGLITDDDTPRTPTPRGAVDASGVERTRPTIQQMIERRAQNANEGTGRARVDARANDDEPRFRTGRVNSDENRAQHTERRESQETAQRAERADRVERAEQTERSMPVQHQPRAETPVREAPVREAPARAPDRATPAGDSPRATPEAKPTPTAGPVPTP